MLYLVPNFFNHRWESKQNGFELIIEIPANIKDILEDDSVKPSNESYDFMMTADLIEKRKKVFKNK